jgi:hypothetical protein
LGLYTVYNDQRVDDAIALDLKLIVETITSALPVRSIILGGGFGRSEGSVMVDGNNIRPVNDYDLFLIISDDIETDLRTLSKELAKKVGIRLLDLIPIGHSALSNLPATQIYYDLKYGGRLLWGENALELIPQYKNGYVEPESGKTLLLNRLICAIEAFSENFEERAITADEAFFLVNQTGKVVSACVEALLIKKNKYHHSYRERQKIFASEFPDRIELQRLNERATEFKVRPSENVTFNPIAYWKDTIKEYLDVLSGYLVPLSVSSKKELWRLLKECNNGAPITNNPVERIEIMLLLYREASFLAKRTILSQAYEELRAITKSSFPHTGWETLRERTTRLWHELYH